MGRKEKKPKQKDADGSNPARDLSDTLRKQASPSNAAVTPPPSKSKKTGSGIPTTLATECHLGDTPFCKDVDAVANVCASLLSDNLGFSPLKCAKLKSQLETYFNAVGIGSDDTLKLFAGKVWPTPVDAVKKTGESVDLLTPAAMLALDQVSKLTDVVRKNQYYLTDYTSHDDLVRYCKRKLTSTAPTGAATGSADAAGVADRKIPTFSLPKYTGDRLDGSEYIKKVERAFKNHGLAAFLESNDYPDYYVDWSTAFTSRILDSLADSDIMSFMAERYKDETNCYFVWTKVKGHLSTSDLSMQRVVKLWREFMGLRCPEFDDFLPFYSKVTKVIDKLKEAKSVAVKDDVFLRAFLARAISCDELQTEAKKFLQDGKGSYDDILEEVLGDYRAQETGEEIRDEPVATSKSRRAEARPASAKSTSGQAAALPKFPTNKGNLIPHTYYVQIKAWYDVMRVPEKDRTDEQVKELKAFKWKHTKPRAPDSSWDKGGRKPRGGREQHRSRSRRSRKRRSPSYSSESSSDRSYRRRSRRSRQRSRSRERRRSYSRSRSASRSPRRGRSSERGEATSSSATASVSRRRVMFGGARK